MTPDLRGAVWKKSSRSGGNGGQCVEVALVGEFTALRDSKNKDGEVLVFDRDSVATFLADVKRGAFSR